VDEEKYVTEKEILRLPKMDGQYQTPQDAALVSGRFCYCLHSLTKWTSWMQVAVVTMGLLLKIREITDYSHHHRYRLPWYDKFESFRWRPIQLLLFCQ